MDAATALNKILDAANADPLRVSFWPHARQRMAQRGATFTDVLSCLREATACRPSEDGPDRWVVSGEDSSGDELAVVVYIIEVLGKGVRCEVVTIFEGP